MVPRGAGASEASLPNHAPHVRNSLTSLDIAKPLAQSHEMMQGPRLNMEVASMATYGPNNGTVPFTGFTPTLGVPDAVTPAVAGSVASNGMTEQDNDIARALSTGWNRATRTLLLSMLGAVVGQSALANKTWVVGQNVPGGSTPQGGGVVQIATFPLISRLTNATDLANVQAMILRSPVPPSYPADLSTNGGGGKLGW